MFHVIITPSLTILWIQRFLSADFLYFTLDMGIWWPGHPYHGCYTSRWCNGTYLLSYPTQTCLKILVCVLFLKVWYSLYFKKGRELTYDVIFRFYPYVFRGKVSKYHESFMESPYVIVAWNNTPCTSIVISNLKLKDEFFVRVESGTNKKEISSYQI